MRRHMTKRDEIGYWKEMNQPNFFIEVWKMKKIMNNWGYFRLMWMVDTYDLRREE